MEAFNPNEGEWLTYVGRLEMFFMVNNVAKDKKGSQFNHLDGRKDVCFAEEFRNADETKGVIIQQDCGNYGATIKTEDNSYH